MGEMSLLDMAAEVRTKAAELKQVASAVGKAGGSWTYEITGEEIEKVARDGLRNAWLLLDRMKQLAHAELERLKEASDAPAR